MISKYKNSQYRSSENQFFKVIIRNPYENKTLKYIVLFLVVLGYKHTGFTLL